MEQMESGTGNARFDAHNTVDRQTPVPNPPFSAIARAISCRRSPRTRRAPFLALGPADTRFGPMATHTSIYPAPYASIRTIANPITIPDSSTFPGSGYPSQC